MATESQKGAVSRTAVVQCAKEVEGTEMPVWESIELLVVRPWPTEPDSGASPGQPPLEDVLANPDMHRAHVESPDVPSAQPLAERGVQGRYERRREASNRWKGVGGTLGCSCFYLPVNRAKRE